MSRRTKFESRLVEATWAERRKDCGTRIRWVREILNEREPGQHTQQRWSDLLGLGRTDLSRWESGTYWPPIPLLQEIAVATGAGLDFLLLGILNDVMDPQLRADVLKRYRDRPEVSSVGDWHQQRIAAAESARASMSPPKAPARVRRSSSLGVVPPPRKRKRVRPNPG